MRRPRNPVPPNTATADRHGIRLTLHHTPKQGLLHLGRGPPYAFRREYLTQRAPGSADLTHGESRLHATRETRPDRIRELVDALKEAERRVAEMRAERDQGLSLSSR